MDHHTKIIQEHQQCQEQPLRSAIANQLLLTLQTSNILVHNRSPYHNLDVKNTTVCNKQQKI